MWMLIDGADEISADFQGIKGGGAALLFEKLWQLIQRNVFGLWINQNGGRFRSFPLPVEVVPYGSRQLVHLFEEKGYHPTLRLNAAGETLITDGGHHIIDLHLEKITHPEALGSYLDNLVGVVEHGLF